jgi:hypothetical protein
MSAPLTNGQKAYLAQLAKKVFDHIDIGGHADGRAAEEKFRHTETAKACGKLGLRCCTQDDYGHVKAHFLNLLGQPGRALAADVRQATNGRRVIEHKIVALCREAGIHQAYADGICKRMNRGKTMAEVDEPKGLWKVFFALRYEAKKRAAERAEETGKIITQRTQKRMAA